MRARSLARLERPAHNRTVEGSNPSGPTNFLNWGRRVAWLSSRPGAPETRVQISAAPFSSHLGKYNFYNIFKLSVNGKQDRARFLELLEYLTDFLLCYLKEPYYFIVGFPLKPLLHHS